MNAKRVTSQKATLLSFGAIEAQTPNAVRNEREFRHYAIRVTFEPERLASGGLKKIAPARFEHVSGSARDAHDESSIARQHAVGHFEFRARVITGVFAQRRTRRRNRFDTLKFHRRLS